MSMLYKLHNQGQDKFVYTCNNCKSHVKTRYHCTVCDDFDLCISCKEKDGHPHHMEKLGLDLDDGLSSANAKQANPQEEKKRMRQRCFEMLAHATQCRGANCRLPVCRKIKLIAIHTNVCKRKPRRGCRMCMQMIAIYFCHGIHCQDTKCLMPLCSYIKHKLMQQRLQQRLQQAQLLRRMALMYTRPTGPVGAMQAGQQTSNITMVTGVAMKLGVRPTNLPSPHQPGIGLKPGLQIPPAHVLQVVKQVQEEAARQQAPHVGYGKVTPGGGVGVGVGVSGQTGGVMPLPQMQRSMPVQMPNPGGTHLIPMD